MDNATKCQTHNTQRLIDANALKEAWKDVAIDGATLSYIYGLFKSVDDAPTIDAVEVVRCKECRHRVHDEERGLYYCEMYYGQGDVSDENFCQWGERSEE